jgi:uncharacterized protein (DUF433 family)
MNYKNIITIEANRLGGTPCIHGTRITIQKVLEFLASGKTEKEVVDDFPYLTEDDIIACMVYGADGENISHKIEKLQFELMRKKTPQERVAIAGKMFMANREAIIASLPKDLSEKEFKKQLYFRTYGEHLPDDFFKE